MLFLCLARKYADNRLGSEKGGGGGGGEGEEGVFGDG